MKRTIKDLDSIKSFIINYISLKILNKDFLIDTQVPSENILAQKFNCSRLTARSAILVLVHLGVLYGIKGSGHYVSESAIKILMPPLYISQKATEIVSKKIDKKDNIAKFHSKYLLNNKKIGEVYYYFNNDVFKIGFSKYDKEKDFCKKIVCLGILGVKVCESIEIINGKPFIKHSHFDEHNNFLFEYFLWYQDINDISFKTYMKA